MDVNRRIARTHADFALGRMDSAQVYDFSRALGYAEDVPAKEVSRKTRRIKSACHATSDPDSDIRDKI
jgi:hypothetical protein